jgi:hypothetical protein
LREPSSLRPEVRARNNPAAGGKPQSSESKERPPEADSTLISSRNYRFDTQISFLLKGPDAGAYLLQQTHEQLFRSETATAVRLSGAQLLFLEETTFSVLVFLSCELMLELLASGRLLGKLDPARMPEGEVEVVDISSYLLSQRRHLKIR